MSARFLAIVASTVVLFGAGFALAKQSTPHERRHQLMAKVSSWGYQLQKLDLPVLSSSPFDLLVIDHAPDRVESVELMFRPSEIAALKSKPDGSRRLVLAYMSIGEAERYRFYWNDTWMAPGNCAAWLGPVNPQWAGNYPVEYWQPFWQSLIFGQSDSYVDRVLAAGFDGIYLDRADVYEQLKSRRTAQADMNDFLVRLMDHARSINPEAIVVLQNAEELVRNKDVRSRLDGIAKESLYFNADSGGKPTPPEDQATVLSDLRLEKKAGGKVLVVEYLDDPAKAAAARLKAGHEGFLIHFTERSLSTLNLLGADMPVAANPVSAAVSSIAPAGDQQLLRASPCG